MEGDNNNKKKNYPSIPSNYVTLLQLQEKWIKGKEKQTQEQLKVVEQPIKLGPKDASAPIPRSNPKRKIRRNNRNAVEKSVVAANESAEKEVNSEELSSSSSKKKRNKKKGKKGRNKNKEETQSRAKEEEEEKEVMGGDTHAPPVSIEKENVSVRQVWLKKGIMRRSEFRPKTDNNVVQSEGLESDRRFRDLSMKQSSEGLESGSVVEVDRKFRDLSMNNRSEGVKHYSRFNRGDYRGEQRRTRSGPGPGVVWVKKGEIIDANVEGNQSSSSSVKELK